MSQIAARIRALREQAFFSQQRLSKTLGIAQSSLCRYETGETEPSAAVLLKYADFFDVSMDYIFGRTDDPHCTGSQKRGRAGIGTVHRDVFRP